MSIPLALLAPKAAPDRIDTHCRLLRGLLRLQQAAEGARRYASIARLCGSPFLSLRLFRRSRHELRTRGGGSRFSDVAPGIVVAGPGTRRVAQDLRCGNSGGGTRSHA